MKIAKLKLVVVVWQNWTTCKNSSLWRSKNVFSLYLIVVFCYFNLVSSVSEQKLQEKLFKIAWTRPMSEGVILYMSC